MRPASSVAEGRFRPRRAALTNALIPTPRITRSRSIWKVTTRRALWLVAEMSPNPTVLGVIRDGEPIVEVAHRFDASRRPT